MDPAPSNQVPQYVLDLCCNRLSDYQRDLRKQPTRKSMENWKNFVNQYYSPTARKSWCFTSYGVAGNYPLENMDTLDCEICDTRSGKGFETYFGGLARLFKIKFSTGEVIDEILVLPLPRGTLSTDGNMIILDYEKVAEETIYQQFRVVHEGNLRIMLAVSDFKILSWKFCCQRHEVLVPATENQVDELVRLGQINQLGFFPYFITDLQLTRAAALVPQQIGPNDDPANDQVVPQINNPADDQNEGVDSTNSNQDN